MKDDAVSPVVGVMIMLTITIILAAVVAAFAGGLAETDLASPVADLSAEFISSEDTVILRLSHNGGDPLNPGDIRVSAFVRTGDASGKSLRISEITASSVWNAGEYISLSPEKTRELLGLDAAAVSSAAALATPVEISLHHIPSSEIIAQSRILMEAK